MVLENTLLLSRLQCPCSQITYPEELFALHSDLRKKVPAAAVEHWLGEWPGIFSPKEGKSTVPNNLPFDASEYTHPQGQTGKLAFRDWLLRDSNHKVSILW